nr:polyprenyl synthetase family protein [Salsipaludibacter albus]
MDRVETSLHQTVEEAAARFGAIDPDLAAVADEVVAFVATGGKRLRPLLVLLGHELTGADGDVVPAAVAVELVHTWALVHDDVIDGDATRRGRATTHRGFAERHAARGWAGDTDHYGIAMAILVGDLVAVLADQSFEQTAADPAHLAVARAEFTAMRLEVMAGQVLDVQVAAERTTDLDRSLRVATLKSGRYSVTRPLQLGARLGGASPGLMDHLARVGDALGVAFQLRDDLLGVLGDPARTGKPVGGDLREGKRTVLVAEAATRLDPASLARLETTLGDQAADDETVRRCIADLVDSGAVDAVQARVDDLLATASAELDDLAGGSAASALHALAAELGSRTH